MAPAYTSEILLGAYYRCRACGLVQQGAELRIYGPAGGPPPISLDTADYRVGCAERGCQGPVELVPSAHGSREVN